MEKNTEFDVNELINIIKHDVQFKNILNSNHIFINKSMTYGWWTVNLTVCDNNKEPLAEFQIVPINEVYMADFVTRTHDPDFKQFESYEDLRNFIIPLAEINIEVNNSNIPYEVRLELVKKFNNILE